MQAAEKQCATLTPPGVVARLATRVEQALPALRCFMASDAPIAAAQQAAAGGERRARAGTCVAQGGVRDKA